MKTTIKILVPLLVLAGIGAIIISTQKSINELHVKPIEQHDFKAWVSQYAADSISGQSYADAKSHYAMLYDMITTEASVIASDGQTSSPLIDAKGADTCYESAFAAYFPVFANRADNFFRGSDWPAGDRRSIKEEAESLKKRQGKSQSHLNSLNNYINYVDGYDKCKMIIRKAQSCRSFETYDYVSKNYSKFCCNPYNHCSDLNGISSAKQTAATTWRNYISQEVREVYNRNYYGDYSDFESDKKRLESMIEQYQRNVDSYWGSSEKNQLREKDRKF